MRLEPAKRLRIVNIFREYKLQYEKNKFEVLKALAAKESIHVSSYSIRRIIKKWRMHSNSKYYCFYLSSNLILIFF
jgi:hypothetical protein